MPKRGARGRRYDRPLGGASAVRGGSIGETIGRIGGAIHPDRGLVRRRRSARGGPSRSEEDRPARVARAVVGEPERPTRACARGRVRRAPRPRPRAAGSRRSVAGRPRAPRRRRAPARRGARRRAPPRSAEIRDPTNVVSSATSSGSASTRQSTPSRTRSTSTDRPWASSASACAALPSTTTRRAACHRATRRVRRACRPGGAAWRGDTPRFPGASSDANAASWRALRNPQTAGPSAAR